ncbi:MAG: Fe-S cluster assembly protein SufD [Actinobacteria bacterium]|nr:Fe-S cluster assembly protein SufD [Actinomycetota bacterium]
MPSPLPRGPLVLNAFTADTAAALPGPAWLRSRRTDAVAALADAALPSPEEEVWRYSRIGDLRLDAWTPATGAGGGSVPDEGDLVGDAVRVDVVDGVVAVAELPSDWVDRGVVVAAASDLDADAAGLGTVATNGPDVFASYNDAFLTDAVVVSVPRGVVLDRPVVVSQHLATTGVAVFPRLVVRLADGAEATVVDRVTSGDGAVLSVPLVELDVARAARLRYLHVQELGPAAWQIGSLVARIDQEADLSASLVGLGGEYARLRTDVRLAGRGANGDLRAAYFGEGDQTLDFRTFQHHDAPDTTSDLLFKGAVGGRSRSVYTGLIRVDEKARGTNAFQTNRNIKLSDEAWAESVPNLEIETNDVRCSHASTVGPVDPEQHFYLESRGVPPHVADRLIVAGFFDEVLRELPTPDAVAAVRAAFGAKLDRVSEDLA